MTEEPIEIKEITPEGQVKEVKKLQRQDPITIPWNVCTDVSLAKTRIQDFWQLTDRYFILSSNK
jgi:hypothetical protein